MRSQTIRLLSVLALLVFGAAGSARAQVCVAIDDFHDTLTDAERNAARMLVEKRFELAGQRLPSGDCAAAYRLSHVRLGNTIVVTLIGPLGRREATAIGLDDLPAVYSQMVRSLITGQPMGSLGVVDRTNVTVAQDSPPRRVQSETFWYARLGYGSIFGERTQGVPALGFGYRAEFDRIGLDVSFFNYQFNAAGGYYGNRKSAVAASLMKLEGLYFTNPTADRTPYFGGGLSWGRTSLYEEMTSWSGQGLQAELTAGYELARATSARVYLQADATWPFYRTTSETFSYPTRLPNGTYGAPTVTTRHRYTPSLVVSIGVGWHRR